MLMRRLLSLYDRRDYNKNEITIKTFMSKVSIEDEIKFNMITFTLEPLGGSKVDPTLHPSEVDKMSNRNFLGT